MTQELDDQLFAALNDAFKDRSHMQRGLENVRAALDAGANPNAECNGFRPVHLAAQHAGLDMHADASMLQLLEEYHADMNASAANGVKPVSLYVSGFLQFGRHDRDDTPHELSKPILDLFQRAGADVNAPMVGGSSALLFAGAHVQYFDFDRLEQYGFKLDGVNEQGAGLPHLLAKAGNVWALRGFVKRGYSLNVQDAQGRTPLHYYAQEMPAYGFGKEANGANLIQLLRDQGVDLWAKDNEGKTALDLLPEKNRWTKAPMDQQRAEFAALIEKIQTHNTVPDIFQPSRASTKESYNTEAATPVMQRILSMFEDEYHGSLDTGRGHAIGNAIRGMLQTYATLKPELLDEIRYKAVSYADRFGAEPILELQKKMPDYVTGRIFTDIEKTQSSRAIDIALWNVARANDAAGLEQLVAAGANPRTVVGSFSIADAAMAGYIDDEFIHGDAWPKALGALKKAGIDLAAKNADGKDAVDWLLHELTRPTEGNSGIPPEEFINSDVITRLREVGMDVSKLEPFVPACAVPTQAPAPAAPAPAPAPHVDGSSIDAKAVPRVDDPQNTRGAA